MNMLFLISSFLAGAAFVIVIELFIVYRWFASLPSNEPKLIPVHKPVINPKHISDYCGIEGATESETCMFLNLIFQFLWKEWRDSPKTRNFFIRKMNLEFQEMLLNKAAGKLMEQITVSDYYLGDSLPVVKKATVMKIDSKNHAQVSREIDVALDLEYAGGFIISLDVDLIFGKSAHFTVKLNALKGRMRLQFTRNPCTHWSFCFYEDPHMDIEVESNFQGKNLPKLTSFIHAQILRSVKKKHTFPRYKVRYKPFFSQEKPQDGKNEVFIHNSLITVGHLNVEIVECTRLPKLPKGSHVYCTLSLDSLPWKEDMPMRRSLWPVHEVLICRAPSGTIGVTFCREFETVDDDKRETILVKTVNPNSPASHVDIQRRDIIISVNNVDITSMKQAVRLVKNAGNKFTFKLQRPPPLSPIVKDNTPLLSPVIKNDFPDEEDGSLEEAQPEDIYSNENEESFDYNSILLHDEDSETEEFVNIIVNEIEKELLDEEDRNKLYEQLRRNSSLLLKDNLRKASIVQQSNIAAVSSLTNSLDTRLNPKEFEKNNTESTFNDNMTEDIIKDKIKNKPHRAASFPFRFGKKKKENSLPSKSISDSGLNRFISSSDESSLNSPSASTKSDNSPAPKKKRVTVVEENNTVKNIFSFDTSENPLGVERDTSIHSTDGDWDNISHQNINAVNDIPVEDEYELNGQKTSLANANQEPVWNEIFSFDVEKEQKFLNICVWGKCEMMFEKDILLGYISIPLMELSVECLSTSCRKSIQTFFLAATENRQAVNRAHLRTMMPGLNIGCCNGDITLAYQYKTSVSENNLQEEEMKMCNEQIKKKELLKEKLSEDITMNDSENSQEHKFIGTEFYFPTRCDYCQNKVWRKVAFQCSLCAMISHKRCIENAQANTYCTSLGVRAKPPIWQKNDSVSTQDEDASPILKSSSPVRSYALKVPNEKDLRPGIRNDEASPNILRRRVKHNRKMSLDAMVKQDKTCNSIPEDVEDGDLNDSITTAAVTAKEAGRELFASLDEINRENDIQEKVEKLQCEITNENENQNLYRQQILKYDDTATIEKLQSALRKSEERVQALALLMIQYCAALNECLLLNEPQQCDL